MQEVKRRRRGRTTVSSKNQVTLPVDALARAGLATGDQLAVEVRGPGELVLRRVVDPVERYSGTLTGIYEPDELDRLRDEWR
jgi:bifunctional DNA-binding transcriptional regulator/antitoxin component of YhaV-PrlF toxin-antitoxin module